MIISFFFFSALLGFRDFNKLEEIKKYISSKYPSVPNENINSADALIIFETSLQKTWLIATEKRMFCVLDDVRKDTFEIRWHLTKEEIIKDDKIALAININPNYKQNTGTVDFGQNHTGWLYSKKFFDSPDKLRKKIAELITSKMLPPESFGEQARRWIPGEGSPPDLTS